MTDSVTDIGEFSHETNGGSNSGVTVQHGGANPTPHPVPEPLGAAVFGVGLLALLILTRWLKPSNPSTVVGVVA